MIHYLDDRFRKLIQTFPGLPEGAGIYIHPNGSKRFYNCAPGKTTQEMPDQEALLDEEEKQARIKRLGLTIVKTDGN